MVRKREFGFGEREGKSSNSKTRIYILRVILGGKEEAGAEHLGLGHFISLPANGVTVHARAEGARAECCYGFTHAQPGRYHGQSQGCIALDWGRH